MITRETDYAIRALLCLARREAGSVTSTTVLAEEMEIPYRFLRRILLKLGEAGLVISQRGKQGGLRLARPAEQVSLLDAVRAVDPTVLTLNVCLTDPAECGRSSHCVVHAELAAIQTQMHQQLDGISLATLVERETRTTAARGPE